MTVQIVPRAAWGARPPKTTPKQLTDFRSGWFIHWLGTPAHRSLSDVAVLRSIQLFHQQAKGWNDIAYSFAIGRQFPDRVYELRGWGIQGGHTEGHNSRSMAVVFLLGEGERPTERMLATCRQFLAEAPDHYGMKPGGPKVRPHNAVRATACPGPDLTAWIRSGMPITPGEPTMPTPPKPPTSLVQQWQEMLLANGADLGPSGADGQMGRLTLEASRVVLDHRNQLLAEVEGLRIERDLAETDAKDLRKANATSSATIVRLTEAQKGLEMLLDKARKANGTAALAQLIATVEGGVAEARKRLA